MMYAARPSGKRVDMYNSDIGDQTRIALMDLLDDPRYKTEEAHTADKTSYPEGKIPFVEKHMLYLQQHQNVKPEHHLSNLRLQLKIR